MRKDVVAETLLSLVGSTARSINSVSSSRSKSPFSPRGAPETFVTSFVAISMNSASQVCDLPPNSYWRFTNSGSRAAQRNVRLPGRRR